MANRRRPSLGLLALAGVLVLLAFSARYLTAQTLPFPSGGVSSSISSGTSGPPSLFPNGSETAPSIAFASVPGMGFFRQNSTTIALQVPSNGTFNFRQVGSTAFNMSIAADTTSASMNLSSAGIHFNSDNATLLGVRQMTATGTTANPVCTGNCGGAAKVAGNNSFFEVTLGSTSPGNPFGVVFSSGYTIAPMCQAQLAKVAGTSLASVSSTNATATGVTVNLTTAPANGQTYTVWCIGHGN